jgi:hypothetical protein
MKLRPVTFRYKDGPRGVRQYGLVAEAVERVHPELVTFGADGKVETVRYSMLTAMLLNELRKQSAELRTQTRENQQPARQTAQQTDQLEQLSAQVAREEALRSVFEQPLAALEQTMRAISETRKLAAVFSK